MDAEKNKDKNGKVLYRLMNNNIYGKTIENLRNKIDVKLVDNEKDYVKYTSKPSYMSHQIFDNNLVAIRKTKVALKLNKPAYIRKCILGFMYKLHYDDIKNKYSCKSKLLFTDSDDLTYGIKTDER